MKQEPGDNILAPQISSSHTHTHSVLRCVEPGRFTLLGDSSINKKFKKKSKRPLFVSFFSSLHYFTALWCKIHDFFFLRPQTRLTRSTTHTVLILTRWRWRCCNTIQLYWWSSRRVNRRLPYLSGVCMYTCFMTLGGQKKQQSTTGHKWKNLECVFKF